MTSANKKILEDLIQEVRELKKMMIEQNIEREKNDEMLHMMFRLLNDLSAKKDLELCSATLKTAAAKQKKVSHAASVKKQNIMAYFKTLYLDKPESLYEIISKAEIETFLKENKSENKSKKGDTKLAQATMLYKKFITGNKDNAARLRAKKEQEEENESTQTELREATLDDEDEKSGDEIY